MVIILDIDSFPLFSDLLMQSLWFQLSLRF